LRNSFKAWSDDVSEVHFKGKVSNQHG
jgi:hypothetical protein